MPDPDSWPMTPPAAHDPVADQRALAEGVRNTVAIARALAGAGRVVDLAGLDQAVGMLCAKTLDLPPREGQAARPSLSVLLHELALLHDAIRANAPA